MLRRCRLARFVLSSFSSANCAIYELRYSGRGLFGVNTPGYIPWGDNLMSFPLPMCRILSSMTNSVLLSCVLVLRCFCRSLGWCNTSPCEGFFVVSLCAVGVRHRRVISIALMQVALCVSTLDRSPMMWGSGTFAHLLRWSTKRSIVKANCIYA